MSATETKTTALEPEEVIALLRGICPALGCERVPLARALGRTLRENVIAPEDQPAFDRSAVDGFAIRLDDPGVEFACVDEIRAGEWKPRQLKPGECVKIGTGGAVPCVGLQVVMQEDTQLGCRVQVPTRRRNTNIRVRGEDARAGQLLVEEGTVLRPGVMALLASVGHARPLVTCLPRILHAVTGNEIVPVEQQPTPGQVRDSNSVLVRAFLEDRRLAVRQVRLAEDVPFPEADLEREAAGMGQVDLLLISGGASVGEHDGTRGLLERLGYAIRVAGTNARPGKPLLVGQNGSSIAIGLPGNPLAHFVCLHLYVSAVLRGWAGAVSEEVLPGTGVLTAAISAGANDRVTFWPARVCCKQSAVSLTPLKWSSSGDVTALATANALIRVPAGCEGLPGGSEVQFTFTGPE